MLLFGTEATGYPRQKKRRLRLYLLLRQYGLFFVYITATLNTVATWVHDEVAQTLYIFETCTKQTFMIPVIGRRKRITAREEDFCM
jgi:hypothetical protein